MREGLIALKARAISTTCWEVDPERPYRNLRTTCREQNPLPNWSRQRIRSIEIRRNTDSRCAVQQRVEHSQDHGEWHAHGESENRQLRDRPINGLFIIQKLLQIAHWSPDYSEGVGDPSLSGEAGTSLLDLAQLRGFRVMRNTGDRRIECYCAPFLCAAHRFLCAAAILARASGLSTRFFGPVFKSVCPPAPRVPIRVLFLPARTGFPASSSRTCSRRAISRSNS